MNIFLLHKNPIGMQLIYSEPTKPQENLTETPRGKQIPAMEENASSI